MHITLDLQFCISHSARQGRLCTLQAKEAVADTRYSYFIHTTQDLRGATPTAPVSRHHTSDISLHLYYKKYHLENSNEQELTCRQSASPSPHATTSAHPHPRPRHTCGIHQQQHHDSYHNPRNVRFAHVRWNYRGTCYTHVPSPSHWSSSPSAAHQSIKTDPQGCRPYPAYRYSSSPLGLAE